MHLKADVIMHLHKHGRKKATIHQLTTMLSTSKNVLFPGHYHLLATGTDDLTLWLSPERPQHLYTWPMLWIKSYTVWSQGPINSATCALSVDELWTRVKVLSLRWLILCPLCAVLAFRMASYVDSLFLPQEFASPIELCITLHWHKLWHTW